jgi:hypothetical protein
MNRLELRKVDVANVNPKEDDEERIEDIRNSTRE